jgi:hypothetical protein
MADIPDQPVIGRVEHIMDRDSQFDHAKAGAQMAAGYRNRSDSFSAKLVGQLRYTLLGATRLPRFCETRSAMS